MKKNLYYITPTVEFIEYASEGVLCMSGDFEGWKEEDLSAAFLDIETPKSVF